eukprot:365874-Chlamydomonas_euryale.AAC.13
MRECGGARGWLWSGPGPRLLKASRLGPHKGTLHAPRQPFPATLPALFAKPGTVPSVLQKQLHSFGTWQRVPLSDQGDRRQAETGGPCHDPRTRSPPLLSRSVLLSSEGGEAEGKEEQPAVRRGGQHADAAAAAGYVGAAAREEALTHRRACRRRDAAARASAGPPRTPRRPQHSCHPRRKPQLPASPPRTARRCRCTRQRCSSAVPLPSRSEARRRRTAAAATGLARAAAAAAATGAARRAAAGGRPWQWAAAEPAPALT